MLRSERSERLEAWARAPRLLPTLRDAALRAAPQGKVCTGVGSAYGGRGHRRRSTDNGNAGVGRTAPASLSHVHLAGADRELGADRVPVDLHDLDEPAG